MIYFLIKPTWPSSSSACRRTLTSAGPKSSKISLSLSPICKVLLFGFFKGKQQCSTCLWSTAPPSLCLCPSSAVYWQLSNYWFYVESIALNLFVRHQLCYKFSHNLSPAYCAFYHPILSPPLYWDPGPWQTETNNCGIFLNNKVVNLEHLQNSSVFWSHKMWDLEWWWYKSAPCMISTKERMTALVTHNDINLYLQADYVEEFSYHWLVHKPKWRLKIGSTRRYNKQSQIQKNKNLSIGSGNKEGILLTSSSHGFRFESIKMSNPKSLKQL